MDSFLIPGLMGIILFEGVLLLIVFSNLRTLRRLGEYSSPAFWPRVTVLVPARNEEGNIGPCVRSLLAQQYPDFTVLVLDDQSSDATWPTLTELAAADDRLQLLPGQSLPSNWLGKHWACYQLAQAADGDLLLFTDADTRHHPLTLRDAVAALEAERADLLTALPQEETVTWAERLLVPLIPWSIFAIVPLPLAYRLRQPLLSATIGQFMLFRRQAYDQIGGYEAVRQHVADDLALGRRIKAQGLTWRLVDGSPRVRCRMYRNFQQVYEGLSKNLFAAFDYRLFSFLFVWSWLAVVFWTPQVMLGLGMIGLPLSPLVFGQAILAIVAALLLWGLVHWRFGFPRYLTIFYPITILLAAIIAIRSMVLTLAGRATWKERTLVAKLG